MGGLQSLASEYGVNLNVADFINDKPSILYSRYCK